MIAGAMIDILGTMALCYVAWGLFFIWLYPRGITFSSRYLWTTAYFALVMACLAYIFRTRLHEVPVGTSLTPALVLAGFITLQLLLYVHVLRRMPEPVAYLATYPNRYYVATDLRRLLSKSVEIAAQQVFILILVFSLRDLGLSLPQIIASFGVLFALLHIPLIATEWGSWPAWVFAGAVVVFSLAFPPILLLVPSGFVYTYIIHWLFYMGIAAAFQARSIRMH